MSVSWILTFLYAGNSNISKTCHYNWIEIERGGGMSVPIGQPRGRTVMSNVASSMRKMSHLFGSGLGAVTHIFHTLSWNFHMLKILSVFITVEIWRRLLLTMYLTSVSKIFGVHIYFSILGSNSISESKNVLHEHLTVNLLHGTRFTYTWNIEMGSLQRKFENENLFDFCNLDQLNTTIQEANLC